MKRLFILVALATGLISHAYAQTYTGQVPGNTVLGNSTGSPVPFAVPGVVTNSQMATAPANTVKCNPTGLTAALQDCTQSQVAPLVGEAWLNTANFGAVCDGVTDDRVAIQNAINQAISTGKPLFLQPSTNGCRVTQTNATYSLLASAPFVFYGSPGASILLPDAATSSTTSILYIDGSATTYRTLVINGIMIGNPSGASRAGLHAIVLDTTAAGVGIVGADIENNYLQQPTSGGGSSIFAVNNVSNTQGGFTYSTIAGNRIGSGISLNSVGDGITIANNVFFGTNTITNIYVNLIANAGNVKIIGNDSGINGSAVIVDCAKSVQIIANEFEHNNTGSTNPLISIAGGVCTVQGTTILGNQLQSLTGTGGTPALISVNTANGTFIDGGVITTATNYTSVIIGSSPTNTVIGAGIAWVTTTTHVSNSNGTTNKISSAACGATC